MSATLPIVIEGFLDSETKKQLRHRATTAPIDTISNLYVLVHQVVNRGVWAALKMSNETIYLISKKPSYLCLQI